MKRKVSSSVGLKIRSLRESHGMSGKELSILLGISQQHQSRYKNDKINIHVDTIYQLAQIFNVAKFIFKIRMSIKDHQRIFTLLKYPIKIETLSFEGILTNT